MSKLCEIVKWKQQERLSGLEWIFTLVQKPAKETQDLSDRTSLVQTIPGIGPRLSLHGRKGAEMHVEVSQRVLYPHLFG